MSPVLRSTLACAGLLAWAFVAQAADDAEIIIATKVTETKVAADVVADLEVRPNTKQPFHIFVKNVSKVPQTFVVELEGLKGTDLKVSQQIADLNDGATRLVEFKPPPPPKKDEPPPRTPAEAKKEAEEAAKAEPPAGVPIKIVDLGKGKLGFGFRIRVRKEVLKGGVKVLEPAMDNDKTVSVTIMNPSTYLTEPAVTLEGSDGRRGLSAAVTAKPRKANPEDKKEEVDLLPPIDVRLVFPPQLALKATALRAGSYQRAINRTGQRVELAASNLPLTGAPAPVKFNLTVDNYPRAFTYSFNARREISTDPAANKIDPDREPAVRLFPVDNSPKSKALSARVVSGTLDDPRFPTLPTTALRFRVEVDNEPADGVLLLRVDRSGRHDFADADEVMTLGIPKDQRVWLDVASGPDGALTLTNTVADHVASVDISALRGPHELQGVLRYSVPGPPAKVEEKKFVYNLIVDDTPPPAEDIKVGPFPKRLERGKPLPVFISALDPDTLIERVAVVVGKPGPDGKFLPDAVVVEAIQTALGWVAQVPLPTPAPAPPPPPGTPPAKKEPVPPIDITVVAENEVGLSTAKVVRIELVEPMGGTLEITVERGGRPQPDTPVTLVDADGKEKGAGKTKSNGKIVFKNLPPGVYKASALKADVSYGLAGFVATTIPDPPPPPTEPVKVTMTLVKRR